MVVVALKMPTAEDDVADGDVVLALVCPTVEVSSGEFSVALLDNDDGWELDDPSEAAVAVSLEDDMDAVEVCSGPEPKE